MEKAKNNQTDFNRNFFKTEVGTLAVNGKETEVAIPPGACVTLPCNADNAVVTYTVGECEVAMAQFITREEPPQQVACVAPVITEQGHRLIAQTKNGEIVFDKDTGEIESLRLNGENPPISAPEAVRARSLQRA